MQIKNTAELIKAAHDHRIADHIVNGFYAEISGKHNGERSEEWSVCAIGCLATPPTLEGLKEEFPDWVNTSVKEIDGELYTFYNTDIPDSVLVDNLERKFGITTLLARGAERFFEGRNYNYHTGEMTFVLSHEERQNWPSRFAEALNENAFITDEMVIDWFEDNVGFDELDAAGCYATRSFSYGQHDDFIEWLKSLH